MECLALYQTCFTRSQQEVFKNYLSGLLGSIRNFSVSGVSSLVGFSYDKLDYFIRLSKWDEISLNKTRLTKDVFVSGKKHFNLVIDDSAQRRFTSRQFYTAKGYIGNLGKVDICTTSVYSFFTDAEEKIPLDFEVYLPKSYEGTRILHGEYRSKLDLALSLMMRAHYLSKELGIEIDYFLFDAWYACAKLLNTVNKGESFYFSEIRSNRWVKLDERKIRAHDLVTVMSSEILNVCHKGKQYQVRSISGSLQKVDHIVKIFTVKGKFSGKNQTKFFITNDLSMSEKEAIELLCMRWDIDYFFRESKTYLCLADSKFHKLRCYKRHIYLCFVAWSVLRDIIREKKKNVTTIFTAIKWLRKKSA